jgi:hypothetical protein
MKQSFLRTEQTLTYSRNHSFSWNVNIHYHVHQNFLLDHILSHKNPAHILPPYLFNITFILSFLLCLGLPSGLLSPVWEIWSSLSRYLLGCDAVYCHRWVLLPPSSGWKSVRQEVPPRCLFLLSNNTASYHSLPIQILRPTFYMHFWSVPCMLHD